jgi:uncharacterized membrane protein
MEEFAKTMVSYLSTLVELVAAIVIGVALLKFIYYYATSFSRKDQHMTNSKLRVKFGSALALSLELMLAADILITAIAPTWDDIGKLAAIAAIRTALNYFLEKELKEIETRESGKEKTIE